eukprot:7577858-Alexandrium_andersonii.AAC.1
MKLPERYPPTCLLVLFKCRTSTFWDISIAGCPKYTLQAAEGPSVLQSASIRARPCRNMRNHSRNSDLDLHGPKDSLKIVPRTSPMGVFCAAFFQQIQILPTTPGIEG